MADRDQKSKSDTTPEKTHGVTWLVIAFRTALFVVYAGLAVTACVYTFAVQGSCMVRQTYTPVSMDSFSGSEMYNGMGIISKPPVSRYFP